MAVDYNQNVSTGQVVGIIGGGLIMVALCSGLLSNCDVRSPSSESKPSPSRAYIEAKEAVKARLKAPATAEFPWSPTLVEELPGGGFRIGAHVDSENSFGAKLRSTFVADVVPVGNDRWEVRNLLIDDGGR